MPAVERVVTFQFKDASERPVVGARVTAVATQPLLVDGHVRVVQVPVTAVSGADGSGSLSLIPFDDPAVSPSDFAYTVRVQLPGVEQLGKEFDIRVPSGTTPLDLFAPSSVAATGTYQTYYPSTY